VHASHRKPVLHSDNGATLNATTVLAMLAWLGIRPSYSRPRVSDDNPFVEAFFRTAKYRPAFARKGFADLDAARQWAANFVHWYNHEHHHSGICYVTPAERHAGQDPTLLACRHALYQQARERNPRRWSGQTRNWTLIAAVTLNAEPSYRGGSGIAVVPEGSGSLSLSCGSLRYANFVSITHAVSPTTVTAASDWVKPSFIVVSVALFGILYENSGSPTRRTRDYCRCCCISAGSVISAVSALSR
jgi:Integrase core domain